MYKLKEIKLKPRNSFPKNDTFVHDSLKIVKFSYVSQFAHPSLGSSI